MGPGRAARQDRAAEGGGFARELDSRHHAALKAGELACRTIALVESRSAVLEPCAVLLIVSLRFLAGAKGSLAKLPDSMTTLRQVHNLPLGQCLSQSLQTSLLSVACPCMQNQDTVQLQIGYHMLEGKRVPLKKPMAILEKQQETDSEGNCTTICKVRQL